MSAQGVTTFSARAGLLALLSLALFGAGFALAADWRFEPVVELGAEWNDNPRLVAADVAANEDAELAARASVRFGFTARTPRTTFGFAYTPSREEYPDFDELSNTRHAISADMRSTLSPRATWIARLGAARAERPRVGLEEGGLSEDIFVSGLSETDTWSGRLEGRLTVATRQRIVLAADARGTRFEEVDPLLAGEVDDTSEYGAEAAWEYDLAERSTWGFSLRRGLYDGGTRGEWDLSTLTLGGRFGSVERLETTVAAGITRAEVSDPGLLVGPEDSDELTASVAIARNLGPRLFLTAGASRSTSGSRGVGGLSLVDSAYVALRQRLSVRHSLSFSVRYADREPLEDDDPLTGAARDLRTLGARVEWAWTLSRTLSLVLSAERVDQDSDVAEEDAVLVVDRNTVGLGLRYSPNAPRR